MTNKTMPERITVYKDTTGGKFPDNLSISECGTGVLLEEGVVEAEYVRADLVHGNDSKPDADVGEKDYDRRQRSYLAWN